MDLFVIYSLHRCLSRCNIILRPEMERDLIDSLSEELAENMIDYVEFAEAIRDELE